MTPVLLVAGTHGFGRSTGRQWWEHGSPFTVYLQSRGCSIIGAKQNRQFSWDTDLDGFGWIHRNAKRHINWECAGIGLYAYLVPPLVPESEDYVRVRDRNIIAHSHGAQVVAYACATGLRVNRLITVGSPVRADMDDVYRRARPNIASWLHVHSDSSDRWQWFGELFDGHLGIVRAQQWADRNKLVAGVSHTKLLEDVEKFRLWEDAGLLDFLTGGPLNAADSNLRQSVTARDLGQAQG